MLTDQFLINSSHGHIEGKRFRAVYENEFKFFTAKNITEARKIAREYGNRLMGGQRVLVVEAI